MHLVTIYAVWRPPCTPDEPSRMALATTHAEATVPAAWIVALATPSRRCLVRSSIAPLLFRLLITVLYGDCFLPALS